jgi:hypothetical protein
MIDVMNDLIIAIYARTLKTLPQIPARGTHVCNPSVENHHARHRLHSAMTLLNGFLGILVINMTILGTVRTSKPQFT